MTTLEAVNKALNALSWSGRTEGQLAKHLIDAREALDLARQFILIDILTGQFQEIDKSELIVLFDVPTQEYRVGNFWMFKAFIESGDKRNLGKVCDTRTEAERWITDIKADQVEFSAFLDSCESSHPLINY